jgi:hypothetical protein
MRTANLWKFAQIGPTSAASPWREHTTGVQTLVFRWPFAAQVWLGWTAIGSHPPVEAAADPVVIEVPTGGNYLCLDGVIASALHLAEIRRLAGSHQCLESALPPGAHDLDLQISAAGRPPAVVCRAAGSKCAWVRSLQNRQALARRRQRPSHLAAIFYNKEPVSIQAAGLVWLVRSPGARAPEAVSGTLGERAFLPQVSTADVQGGVHIELALVLPDFRKPNVLGMTDEPGGFVVE